MNIGYIVFGDNIDNHLQANFSILSVLCAGCDATINVITDQPGFYAQFSTTVNIIEINEHTLIDWRGANDYIYRIKIKAAEKINQLYPHQPLLVLDADTFIYRDLSDLRNHVNSGRAFMHKQEGRLSQIKWKAQRLMWKKMQFKTFGGLKINEKHTMWNAGVVLLPGPKNDHTITMALQLCDEMLSAGGPSWLVEQFASSLAISENYEIMEAEPWICHYWGNKPAWNQHLRYFFAACQVENLSVSEQIERFKRFDITSMPISVRRNKGFQKISALAEKMFPYRHVQYLRRVGIDNALNRNETVL
jgi:hypothetical protein